MFFFFSSRRRHTRYWRDWSSDVCSSDLYDKDGAVAAKGKPLDVVASEILNTKFFRRKPPKTAGREEFGREFVDALLKRCGSARKEDIVATATEITARSIAEAVRALLPRSDDEPKR